jgi:2-alkyl-3-oxoalkanoate reductase
LKIFITGITGFVGGVLANYFIKMGYAVTGIGRSVHLPLNVNNACGYLQQDITKILLPIKADIVIHSAAITSDSASYDELYLANTIGTRNVINACVGVKKFILISTSSVYSFTHNKAYREEDAGNDFDLISDYGKTKFLAEKELLQCNKFEHFFILRPRAIYGVGDTVLLPRLLKLVKGNKLYLPASIAKKISLTHIDSLVNAVILSIEKATMKSTTYNIADAEPYCLKTCIVQLTEAALQRQLQVKLIPPFVWNMVVRLNKVIKFIPELTKFGSKQLTNDAVLDIAEAIKELNYKPTNNFTEISKAVGVWYNLR